MPTVNSTEQHKLTVWWAVINARSQPHASSPVQPDCTFHLGCSGPVQPDCQLNRSRSFLTSTDGNGQRVTTEYYYPRLVRKNSPVYSSASTHMALQAQQQATPSPTRDRAGSGEWLADTEKLPGAAASPEDVVVASTHHAAAAARYVPPRATSHTAEPNPGRGGGGGWYSWNGGRRARHDPPAPRRQQPAKTPPPAPPLPAAPPPPPAASPAPAPRAPPPHAQVRSADRVVPAILSRKRRAAVMQRAALLARAAAAGLCLAALAVLASDTRRGWARDSYSNYAQFRYARAHEIPLIPTALTRLAC
jgi:hypothetical protein